MLVTSFSKYKKQTKFIFFNNSQGTLITVVKNIPEVNAMLWKIKHLVSVQPILFPYGEPTEKDINYTVLKENGDCIVTKEIKIEPERIEATEQFEKRLDRMDTTTLKRDSRMRWLSGW